MNTPDVPAAASFDEVVLPHLDAARRLARWLLGNEDDAEDAVQEAALRALRYFRTFSGVNARAWFLRIVRNTCYGWRDQQGYLLTEVFDETQHSDVRQAKDPEALLVDANCSDLVEQALQDLPDRFRKLLVLREFEGLSYQELADEIGITIGTVMSGLSRARQALRSALDDQARRRAEVNDEVLV